MTYSLLNMKNGSICSSRLNLNKTHFQCRAKEDHSQLLMIQPFWKISKSINLMEQNYKQTISNWDHSKAETHMSSQSYTNRSLANHFFTHSIKVPLSYKAQNLYCVREVQSISILLSKLLMPPMIMKHQGLIVVPERAEETLNCLMRNFHSFNRSSETPRTN